MQHGKRKGTGHAVAKREMGECTSEMKGTIDIQGCGKE